MPSKSSTPAESYLDNECFTITSDNIQRHILYYYTIFLPEAMIRTSSRMRRALVFLGLSPLTYRPQKE